MWFKALTERAGQKPPYIVLFERIEHNQIIIIDISEYNNLDIFHENDLEGLYLTFSMLLLNKV